jgi:hypothetical protein
MGPVQCDDPTEQSWVEHAERHDPLTRILRLDSLRRRERATATGLVALFAHVGFALWAAGWAASHPRDALAEMQPIVISVGEASEDSAGSGEGPGGPMPGGERGSDERPVVRAVSPPARASPRPAGSPMTARASATNAKRDLLDDPFAKWMLSLPDDAWKGANGGERNSPEGRGAVGANSGGGANGRGAGGGGSGGRGGSGGSGQGDGRGAHFLPDWDCDFPAWAKVDGLVRMVVTVRPDGAAVSVEILSDTGRVFADRARECAMRQRFIPARNARGRPVLGKTGPFNVRFIH